MVDSIMDLAKIPTSYATVKVMMEIFYVDFF